LLDRSHADFGEICATEQLAANAQQKVRDSLLRRLHSRLGEVAVAC